MRYLLDTHTLLWAIGRSSELSREARTVLEDPGNEIFVSTISLWEISLKYALGRLVLGSIGPEDIPSYCGRLGFEIVPVDAATASTYHLLRKSEHHRDPFDRMLVHQCIREKMALVSRDARMRSYEDQGLICVW